MGSLISEGQNYIPQIYNFCNYEQVVNDVNDISNLLAQDLQFNIAIEISSLCFNYSNWKYSKVKTVLGLFPTLRRQLKQKQLQEQHLSRQFDYEHQLEIKITMKQLYKIHQLLQHFKTELKKQFVNTPTTQGKQQKICVICFDEESDLALPCGVLIYPIKHAFGPICISKFIIQKQEKLCPLCRRRFIGSRSSIERNLYKIIDNNDILIYNEVRGTIFDELEKGNEKEINEAKNLCMQKLRCSRI